MISKFLRFLLACSWLLCFANAQTLGGTVVSNQAEASYTVLGVDSSGSSNEVESVVPSFCTFAVTPDGNVATPARVVDAIPGVTVYFPYTLAYAGNVITAIDVTALVEVSSTLLPASTQIILDNNNNGLFDAGELPITSVNVALGSSTSLLLAVTLAPSYPSAGTIDVNLRANCEGSAVFDEDNLSRVNVLEGGVTALSKTSVPSAGQITAGDALTYTVGFTVNQVALANAVLTDVLNPNLATPTALSVTVNGVARPSSSVIYESATQTVTATLGTLNPGDRVALTIATSVLASTPGAVTIDNTATLSFTGGSINTNTVTHTTPATCNVLIKPDGSVAAPAFSQNALPSDTVIFPYTLSNAGNISNNFLLETALSNNTFSPNISIILDANNNGSVDASETAVISITGLARNASVSLLLVVVVPNDTQLSGDAFVNLIGRCASAPIVADDDNISQVTVPNGGITNLRKSSEPVEAQTLYPGAELHYFIEFEVNGRDLSNVVISDVLDERLTAPSSFTIGEIRDDESGLTATVVGNYDAATRKVTWTFASVPARIKVRLEIITSVKADVLPQNGDVINNTATFSSTDVPETSTNTVTHPLNTLEILLSKKATPERVFVGDTLTYTLTIVNPQDSIALRELILSDDLPNELRYQPGTARVTLPGQTEQGLEPTVAGQKLTWTLPGIAPGEQILVTIGTEVLASATQVQELVNTAEVVASDVNGRAVADAAAEAATVIDKGVFTAPAVLLGTVFEDLNGNNLYDEDSDIPVQNVRVYLSDGRSVLSDELGRYTFLDLRAGIDVVKVDATTLPARLLSETKTETRPGLWRVRLEQGLITRQDVPLLPPGARLAISQALNVVMGTVRVQKSVVVTANETTVILTITSSAALKGLTVQDVLPTGVTASEAVSDDMNALLNNLTFNLGDVTSGYTLIIQYTVEPRDIPPTELLIAPTISWQVRP